MCRREGRGGYVTSGLRSELVGMLRDRGETKKDLRLAALDAQCWVNEAALAGGRRLDESTGQWCHLDQTGAGESTEF